MNLPRALRYLERAGVTADVLRAGGVDPDNPEQVRREVDVLLASASAEVTIVSMEGFALLQLALRNLLTAADRDATDALARAIRTDLVAAGVVRPAPLPDLDEAFEACLAEC